MTVQILRSMNLGSYYLSSYGSQLSSMPWRFLVKAG